MQSASFFNNIKFYSSLATDHNSPANISNIIESVHSRNKKKTISVHTETSAILIIDVSLSHSPIDHIFHFAHINENVTYAHLMTTTTTSTWLGDEGMSYWLFNRERERELENLQTTINYSMMAI